MSDKAESKDHKGETNDGGNNDTRTRIRNQMRNQNGMTLRWGSGAMATTTDRGSEELNRFSVLTLGGMAFIETKIERLEPTQRNTV
jgi:hypothetical protein